jgi:hypothetical protein
MDEATRKFLADGVRHYAEAAETVGFFRDRVVEMLDRVLREGARSDAFEPAEKRGRTTADAGANQYWITVFTGGRVGGKDSRIEMGIWWNAPETNGACVAYANLRDQPEGIVSFSPVHADASIRKQLTATKFTRLYRVIEDGDIEAGMTAVLAALQEGVKAQLARTAATG